jgi:acetolactate synthase-1/2/3 large subunit
VGSQSVADVVARTLAVSGVKYAFGHPGGEVVVLIDALRRHGIPFVLTRHETTAAFMAGGQGELTGVPGACVATLGPGATNLVSGVASAFLERAPLVALTGALAKGAAPGTTHQAIELNGLFSLITKRSIELEPESAASEVATSVQVALRRRSGPVHLSLPSDVAPKPSTGAARTSGPIEQEAAAASAEPALALLSKAARPVVVLGLDAVHDNAADSVRAFARHIGAPVVCTPKAKGLFPEDDPQFAGVLEMAGDDLIVDSLQDADLVFAVGLDVVELDKPWRLNGPVVHVSPLANEENYYPAQVELLGSIERTLQQLMSEADGRGAWANGRLETQRAELSAFLRPQGSALQPWQVVDSVRRALPISAIATTDVGIHKMLVGQLWSSYQPREFFQANGLSSMGYSIPVAAAVRLLRPNQDVVAFVGDGGLGMYLGELETLVRVGIDLLIVVLVDDSLEMIRRVQLRRDLPTDGTAIINPDFAALGRAFGIKATEVGTLDEMEAAAGDLATAPGVRLLAARVDRQGYRL